MAASTSRQRDVSGESSPTRAQCRSRLLGSPGKRPTLISPGTHVATIYTLLRDIERTKRAAGSEVIEALNFSLMIQLRRREELLRQVTSRRPDNRCSGVPEVLAAEPVGVRGGSRGGRMPGARSAS